MKSFLSIKLLCEFIGVAIITATALASNQLTDSIIIKGLLIGVTVSTLIHCFGRISGAHFNPAVTFYLSKKFSMRFEEQFAYIFFQTFGAVVSIMILQKKFFNFSVITPTDNIFFGNVLFTEFIFTSLLLLLISSWEREGKLCPISQPLTGVVIGMGLSIFVILSEFYGSGILNPAISIAIAVNEGPHMLIPKLTGQLFAVIFVRITFSLIPEKALDN